MTSSLLVAGLLWVADQGSLSQGSWRDRWLLTSNEAETHFTYASCGPEKQVSVPFTLSLNVTPLDATGIVRTLELDVGGGTVVFSVRKGALLFLPMGGVGQWSPDGLPFAGTMQLLAERLRTSVHFKVTDGAGVVAEGTFPLPEAVSVPLHLKAKGIDGRRFRMVLSDVRLTH